MAKLAEIPWWQWIPGRAWRIVSVVAAADEIPTRLPTRGIVLVGNKQRTKWLAFDCPCHTGHRIMINLDPAHYPCWTVSTDKDLTISPSIDYQTAKRRCHYFIKRGRTVWTSQLRGRLR